MKDSGTYYNFFKSCHLLRNECVREEIQEQIKSYNLISFERKNGNDELFFSDQDGNHLFLTLSFNHISLVKYSPDTVERITIDNHLSFTHRTVDKRENGILYSIVEKQFSPANQFENHSFLVDLTEERYVLTKNSLENLFPTIDLVKCKLPHFLFKLIILDNKPLLREKSDYYSEFSTHMDSYLNSTFLDKENDFSATTYLNGEDISKLYPIRGMDKLYRIFDLYRGIINPRNESDINSIHFHSLSTDAYDLKSLKGITQKEDSLIGKSSTTFSQGYLYYLNQMLESKFGYKGELNFDRKSILAGITYNIAKAQLEKILGIPYSEFEQLDADLQHKLIEQKKGKKLKADHRLYIDGIPMDDEHILTSEDTNRQLEELTSNKAKKILIKIMRPFRKK